MTNPIIEQLMSSIINGQISVNDKAIGKVKLSESGEDNRHFSSDMMKALQVSKNSDSQTADESTRTDKRSNKKGYKYYLESFKKELLVQGKSLNNTFIDENDLPLIKTFLLQCGFSDKKAEQFLKNLKADNPNGEISLSQLFHKMAELGEPKRKENQDETIAPATVPYIESILRDFNLDPKELDSVFSKARAEGGGLDLQKLVAELKKIKRQRPLESKTAVNQNLSRQISEKMEMIGMSIPDKGKTDQISFEDFVASLDKIAENACKEKKMALEIKNTMSKILEQVEVSEKKPPFTPSAKVSSNYNFTDSLIKEDKKNDNAFNEKVISLFEKDKSDKNEVTSSLEKGKSGKDEFVSSFLKRDGDAINKVKSDTKTLNNSEKVDSLSDLKKQTELINSMKEEGYRVDTEAGQINVSRNTEALNFTNAIKAVETGEKSLRGYLPSSIVDQVGKQISRSILRGDQVVTLQLKPPELGTVKINMDIKDHTLKLNMIADDYSARELLLNNVHELKEALVQHGIKLEKVDVQINYDFGQSLNASKERTDNGQEGRKEFHGEESYSDNHIERSHEKSLNTMPGSNLVDLVA
jgi:flagellar hook-length control protein FliK